MIPQLPPFPSRVYLQHEEPSLELAAACGPTRHNGRRAEVRLEPAPRGGLSVCIHCPQAPLSRVVLRWDFTLPQDTRILGDHWERGYGDLQWRHLQPERLLPWYWAAHHSPSGHTLAVGVETQPAAFCAWTVDADGASLWIDTRCGGSPCLPGPRILAAATVQTLFSEEGESPFALLRRFCLRLCPAPRLPPEPVCGNNNWYYAYGQNFDAAAMRRDGAFLAELSEGHRVRPFCVIDAGWSPGAACPGGPWHAGWPDRFPDMPGLAAELRRLGVRPGLWVRPSAISHGSGLLRDGPRPVPELPLDISQPEVLEGIRADIARLSGWGYDLIKHDFTSYDAFGRWGFEMGLELTDPGWSWRDRTRTNAEIILGLYRALREGAGDSTLLLGCNTVGHLGAGLFEVQRTGDDTSGRIWERTRRMGVNTLAFRQPQHGAFFLADADCAAHTERTPWEMDRRFLDLVARSGTCLFVSADPTSLTAAQKAEFRRAMLLALSGGEPGGIEPLDWLQTTAPRLYRCAGRTLEYRWEEASGAWPLRC